MPPGRRNYRGTGYRGTAWQPNTGDDPKMSRSRVAWMSFFGGKIVLHAPSDSEGSERGTSYSLFFPNRRGRDIMVDLTGMTLSELEAFKSLIDLAYERALPTVKLRDKAAEDALANGDDSDPRVYRLPAQFIVRKGTVGENDSGVHNRLEDLSDGDGGSSTNGSVRATSDELAPDEPSDDGSQDNG